MDGAVRAKGRPEMSKQDVCEWKVNSPQGLNRVVRKMLCVVKQVQ
jgi:hypothetical protein